MNKEVEHTMNEILMKMEELIVEMNMVIYRNACSYATKRGALTSRKQLLKKLGLHEISRTGRGMGKKWDKDRN